MTLMDILKEDLVNLKTDFFNAVMVLRNSSLMRQVLFVGALMVICGVASLGGGVYVLSNDFSLVLGVVSLLLGGIIFLLLAVPGFCLCLNGFDGCCRGDTTMGMGNDIKTILKKVYATMFN
jgi:hypothetical protein